MKKLAPLFQIFIEDITPVDVQRIIDNEYAKGRSKSILLHIRLVYGMVVDYAVKKGYKVTNYIKHISIPKNAKKASREALTESEIITVNENVDKPFGLYAYLMLYTGLRRGELCALQWKDVDLENKLIHVNKSIAYINNRPHVKRPKTAAGMRSVPILKNVSKYLKKPPNSKNLYIFSGDEPFTDNMITKRWKDYTKMTGLTITQHQLRHTYATVLYKAGIDVKTAQELLGHADVQTTPNIYTHLDETLRKQAVQNLNQYLNTPK